MLTDNNHMLPALITLILSALEQEHSPGATHTHTGEQHAMPSRSESARAVLSETLSSGLVSR